MRESQLQTKIRKRLEEHHWLVIKLIQTNRNGIPDLMCIKGGRVMFLEIKTPEGVVSELQKHMLDKLNACGCHARVIRSLDEIDVYCGKTY